MARANAIAAKVRSLHGEQLDERDYAELLGRRNVPEIAAYLKNETHYKYALRDVRENNVHRGQLEDLLRKDVFREVIKLYRYADRKEAAYYHLYIEENEIKVILETLRMMISGRYDDAIIQLPLFLKEFASFDLMKIALLRQRGALSQRHDAQVVRIELDALHMVRAAHMQHPRLQDTRIGELDIHDLRIEMELHAIPFQIHDERLDQRRARIRRQLHPVLHRIQMHHLFAAGAQQRTQDRYAAALLDAV